MADSKDAQYQKFKEAARELGCEDSEEAFDEALKKVAQKKLKSDAAPTRKAKFHAQQRQKREF